MSLDNLKVKLILLVKGKIGFGKGIYVASKGIVKEVKGFWRFTRFVHNYEVDPKHFFNDPKGKTWIMIDVNSRKSMTVGEEKIEVHGQSIELKLKKELDTEKANKLDYLTESSFWDSLNLKKRDIVETLITMGCGIGLYSVLRLILSMYGYYLP